MYPIRKDRGEMLKIEYKRTGTKAVSGNKKSFPLSLPWCQVWLEALANTLNLV